jgi:hypothetical protein
MLRFGDGTPFPLDEGFLEVLVDAVGACTAMLTATALLEERHARARTRQHELMEDECRLERFEQTVRMAAMTPASANRPKPTPAELAFRRTVAAMQHAVKHSREQLKTSVAENAAELGWAEAAAQVALSVAGFFERHMLPGAVWSWAWDATAGSPSFEATARGAQFTVAFELERDVLWRAPIRLSALAPGVVIDLPRRRWFGKPVVVPTPLDRCVLVGARCDPEGHRLEIQERAGAAPGWRITLPRDGTASATAFDRRGRAIAVEPITPSQLDALVDAIDLQLRTRRCARRTRTVFLGGVPVDRLDDTTTAARALLDELGPIVREIRARSVVPGELSLKRDVAAGMREEVFVSRVQLAACYASLPPQYRHLLDAIGVGRGLTETLGECSTEVSSASTLVVPPAAPAIIPTVAPPTVAPPRAAPPPIPKRPRAYTPTAPVKSLSAIRIQHAGAPLARMALRPATSRH